MRDNKPCAYRTVIVFFHKCKPSYTVYELSSFIQGVTRGWTRKQCDNAFYNDMYNACLCRYPSVWSWKFYSCKGTALTLWKIVDVFSGSYFGKKVKDFCKKDCILPYGSPTQSLMY